MKLSKSHLDMISGSAPGELEVVLHPTEPLIIIEVVGTAVLMTMDPKQVEVLEKRLAQHIVTGKQIGRASCRERV